MSARALVVLALLAAGCHATARCRAGTVFVDLAGATGADQLHVAVTVGGRVLNGDQVYSGQAGIEIDFPDGYPTGQPIEVTVTALQGGAALANGSISSTLDGSCARLSISLVSLVEPGADLAGQDPGTIDLASNGSGPTDLATTSGDLALGPATWTPVTVNGTPPAPNHSDKMVYDSLRDQVVLFDSAKTWLWSATTSTWTLATPMTSPTDRTGYGMTYDSDRHVVVMFGGQNSTSLNEVWEWNGTTWANKTPASGPWDVQATAIAFHAARHRTVLFGGYSQNHSTPSHQFAETWEWDGSAWAKQSSTLNPAGDSGHSLAYDSARQMVVLAASNAQGNATWEYDASGQWNKRTPATSPGQHRGVGLAYDSLRGVTVLFGGSDNASPNNNDLDDTWEWNGTNWSHTGTTGPTPRRALAMTYDSLRQKIWLFGGGSGHSPTTKHNDVWSWQ